MVLWVKLLDTTSWSSKVLSTIGANRKVKSRLYDCTKKSEINA